MFSYTSHGKRVCGGTLGLDEIQSRMVDLLSFRSSFDRARLNDTIFIFTTDEVTPGTDVKKINEKRKLILSDKNTAIGLFSLGTTQLKNIIWSVDQIVLSDDVKYFKTYIPVHGSPSPEHSVKLSRVLDHFPSLKEENQRFQRECSEIYAGGYTPHAHLSHQACQERGNFTISTKLVEYATIADSLLSALKARLNFLEKSNMDMLINVEFINAKCSKNVIPYLPLESTNIFIELDELIAGGGYLNEASDIKEWANMDYNDPVPFHIKISKNDGKYYLTCLFSFFGYDYDELFEYNPIIKKVGKFLGSSVNIHLGHVDKIDGTLLSAKARKEYDDYLKEGNPVVYKTITKIEGRRPLHDAEIFKFKKLEKEEREKSSGTSKPALTVSGASGLNVRPKKPFTVSTTRGANIPPSLANAAPGAGSAIPLSSPAPAPAPTPAPAPAPATFYTLNNLNSSRAAVGSAIPLTRNLLRQKTPRKIKPWSRENIERARLESRGTRNRNRANASRGAIPLTANLLTDSRYAHINPPILPENDWNVPASIPITSDLVSAAGAGDRVPRRTRRARKGNK